MQLKNSSTYPTGIYSVPLPMCRKTCRKKYKHPLKLTIEALMIKRVVAIRKSAKETITCEYANRSAMWTGYPRPILLVEISQTSTRIRSCPTFIGGLNKPPVMFRYDQLHPTYNDRCNYLSVPYSQVYHLNKGSWKNVWDVHSVGVVAAYICRRFR